MTTGYAEEMAVEKGTLPAALMEESLDRARLLLEFGIDRLIVDMDEKTRTYVSKILYRQDMYLDTLSRRNN